MPKGVSGHPIGNRNPGRRGLDKEMKRLKGGGGGGKKNNGCPLFVITALAYCASAVTAGWFLASALDYWIS